MRRTLTPHPDSRCAAISRIEIEMTRDGAAGLQMRYAATGRMRDVMFPAHAKRARADELWRHTCFEAFIRPPYGETYYELNVSPSTQWAAYRFNGYRVGMAAAAEIDLIGIETVPADDRFELYAQLNLEGLGDLRTASRWRVGVAAVIEETNGGKSYWALSHPPGKPDFHHLDGFVLDLEAGKRA